MLVFDSVLRPSIRSEARRHARWLVVEVFAVLALVSLGAYHAALAAHEMNADAIYPLAIGKTALVRGTASGWMLPPAAGVVPDVLMSILGLVLGFDGYENIIFVFGGFVAMLAMASLFLLQCAGFERGVALIAVMLAVAVFLFVDPARSALSVLLVAPNHHQNAIVFSAAGFGLAIRMTTSRNDSLALACGMKLVVLVTLGVLSDAIVVAQLVAPVVAFAILLLIDAQRHRATVLIACGLIGTVLGQAMGRGVELATGVLHGATPVAMQWSQVVNSWASFTAGIPKVMANAGWGRATLALVSLPVLVVLVVRLVQKKGRSALGERRPALLVLILLSSLAGVLAPLMTGAWLTPAHFRYQLPIFFLPSLAIVAVTVEHTWARWSRWPRLRIAAMGVVSAILCSWAVRFQSGGRGFLAKHEELWSGLRSRMVSAVVAEYWDAKPLVIASDSRLQVCQVDKGGAVYPWLVDLTWCAEALAALAAPESLVAVVGRYLEPLDVVDKFGPPLWSESLAGFQVWYYPGTRLRHRLLTSGCSRFRRFDGLEDIAQC